MKSCHIMSKTKLPFLALCAILTSPMSLCQASAISAVNTPLPGPELTAQPSLNNSDMAQLGKRLLRQGEFAQALSLAEQMLAQQSQSRTGLALRAAAYLGDQQIAQFKKTAEEFQKLYPRSPILAKNLATMYASQGEFAQAKSSYRAALRQAPEDPETLLALGTLALRQGQQSQARKRFNQILKINKLPVKYYLNANFALCRIDLAAQKHKQVIKRAEQLTRRYPPISISYQLLATAYLAQGQPDKAIKTYKRLRDVTPDSAQPYQELALIYAEYKDDFSKASSFANQAVEKNRKDGKSYDIRGWIFFNHQQFKEALSSFQTAVGLAPGSPAYLYHQGLALEKLDRQQEARDSFTTALNLLGQQHSPLRQELQSALQR